MSMRFVCIEVRKNLHCANVFLQFEQTLTEIECLKINVDADALRLRTTDAMEVHIPLMPHLTVEASTMSNLTVADCNASFRLTVASLGEPAAQHTQLETVRQEPPQLQEDCGATSIHCANCKCALTAAPQVFQRIREFPSGSIDMSEFFCHHGPDLAATLVPQITDCFYGYQFLVLNTELIRAATKEKETHLYCRRCLQYLGATMYEGRACKLWTDTLRLRSDSSAGALNTVYTSDGSERAIYELLQKIISDCAAVAQPTLLLQQMQFSKVLLETSYPDRQSQYLLLHILEKQLPVLRNVRPLTQALQEVETLELQLTPCQCIKLLYRQLAAAINVDDEAAKMLLHTWQSDISIHTINVSPTLFSALLTELDENSLLLPELYRYTRDDFQLSYVF